MIVEIENRKVRVVRGNPNIQPSCLLVNSLGIRSLHCFDDKESREEFYNKHYKRLDPIVKCKRYRYAEV